MTARLRRGLLPRLLAVLIVLGVWQLLVVLHVQVSPYLAVPGPADVATAIGDLGRQGHLVEAVYNSLRRAAVGYAAALVIGTVIGAAVARISLLRSGFGSLQAGLQSLPSVTWVPIGILIFGLSEGTIYFVVVLGAFPSIAMGVISAVDQIPPLTHQLARSLGARGWQFYRHFMISAALPGYVAGMKQAWAFSWRSLMAAELIAVGPDLGLGLGQLLENGRAQEDLALMLAAMIVILIVGLAMDDLVFGPLERGLLRRRGLAL